MKPNLVVLLLVIVLGAGAAALLLLREPPPAPPAATGSTEPRDAASAPEQESAGRFAEFTPAAPSSAPSAATPPQSALPPVDALPVRELLSTLDERARRGDVMAACRLASELLRCRNIARWNERATQYQIDGLARSKFAGAELERRTNELAGQVDYNLGVRERCAGLTPEELRRVPRYAFAAAQRGHVPSMLMFADAAGIGGQDLVADPEFYAAYRTHAWPMFRRAFDAGHPRAVAAWSWALNSGGYRFLGGVLPDDWQRPGLALALLARVRADLPRTSDRALAQPVSIMGVTPTQEEKDEAEALYARHFAGSKWMRSAADTVPPENPGQGGFRIDEDACTDPDLAPPPPTSPAR